LIALIINAHPTLGVGRRNLATATGEH